MFMAFPGRISHEMPAFHRKSLVTGGEVTNSDHINTCFYHLGINTEPWKTKKQRDHYRNDLLDVICYVLLSMVIINLLVNIDIH